MDSELLRTVRALAPARQALFARYGLSPRFAGCDLLSPHLTVAFTTEALAGPRAGVALVGPSLPRAHRGDEPPFDDVVLNPTLPLVYMSLGSQIYHQPALFRRAIAAVTDRPVQLLLSASELAGAAELGPLPANVVAARYLPQLAILERAAAFVTHGGANSVMEAIARAVPLLVAPLCNDQFHQAHFVTRAGVGLTLDLASATTDDVWRALATLLADGPLRARMTALAESYRNQNGAAETARLVSALAAAKSRPAPT
jgi:MGT family glycosyltransferase